MALLAFAGYWFAFNKSQPVYMSKIDQLMFDTKNKPPKFLLTLPDNERLQNITVTNLVASRNSLNKDPNIEAINSLKDIPLLGKLTSLDNHEPLKIIDKQNTDKPWSTYAKKTDIAPNFYKVVILIKSVGLDKNVMEKTLKVLPDEVSISFSPYTVNLAKNIKQARLLGHETYLDLLLSPKDFLKSDNGPKALSITASLEDNIKKVKTSLDIDAAIGGLIISRGIIDESAVDRIKTLLDNIQNQGLLILDASNENKLDNITVANLARDKADILLDYEFNKESITDRLAKAEIIAKENGHVLIVAEPKPIVLTELIEWINTFSPPQKNYNDLKDTAISKPFALAPLSSVVIE